MGMWTYLLAIHKPFLPHFSFSPVFESGDVAYQLPARLLISKVVCFGALDGGSNGGSEEGKI